MSEMRRSRPRKTLPDALSPKRGTLRLGLVLAVLVGINLYVFLWRGNTSIPAVMEQAAMAGKRNGAAGGGIASSKDSAQATPSAPGKSEAAPGSGSDQAAAPADEAEEDDEDAAAAAGSGRPVPEKADEDGRWVEGQVQNGDSLGRILRRENMSPPEADEVIRALGEHMDLRKIRPGQTYRLHFDDNGRLIEFEFHLSKTTTVRARRGKDGTLVGSQDKAPTDVRLQEIGVTVDSSLYAAIKAVGEDATLVAFFVDVFAYDVNFFTDTRKGDRIRMLVEKEYIGDKFLRYGRVLAAEYSGKAGTFQAFWFKSPGASEGSYYNAKGESVEKSLLKTPLKYSRISSKFNPNRMHPVLHRRRGHMGVDYAAPTGTPVWSAADGVITARGYRGGAGNCVIVKHDNGLETVYMHLSSFRKGQAVGQRVKSKSVIGYVGATGLATGPHLHFGVKQNGRYIDPLKLKSVRRGGVGGKHKQRFLAEASRLRNRLQSIAVVTGSARGGESEATFAFK